MTCSCCPTLSPFHYAEHPRESIFVGQPGFFRAKTTGKTMSQTCSESVEKIMATTGRSPGTIRGISDKADKAAEAHELARRAAR